MTVTTTGQKAIVRYAIIAGQPWAEAVVEVVEIDGDRLRHTTDGIWFSETTRGQYSDWSLMETPQEQVARLRIEGAISEDVCASAYPLYLDDELIACDQPAGHAGPHQLGRDFGVMEWEHEGPSSVVCPIHGAGCEAWA